MGTDSNHETTTEINTAEGTGPPDRTELRRGRWERAWTMMEDHDYDALVLAHQGMITEYGYLTYFAEYFTVLRSAYAVIFPEEPPTLILPTRADAYLAENRTGLETVQAGTGDVIAGEPALGQELVARLTADEHDVSRVGIAGMNQIMNVEDYRHLVDRLPDVELIDATDTVGRLKTIKEPAELPMVRESADIGDAAIKRFLEIADLGMTGWELRGEMEHVTQSRGAKEVLTFVGQGPYFLHRPTADPIEPGDLLTVYSEVVGPNDYWTERAITCAVGDVSERKQQVGEACYDALSAAEDALHPGNTAADVAQAIEAVATEVDVETGIWHGHGVGVDHDQPVIGVNNDTTLEAGMVISVHPNFSDESSGIGASVADTYAITDDGYERLSSLPRTFRTIKPDR
ncbi:Xaa-Pro peptidase family protein [Natrarchaeobius chitinivorans]|nr:Xaa-Pro peptidase family protein [Natrarchaeobius chitinivorans]